MRRLVLWLFAILTIGACDNRSFRKAIHSPFVAQPTSTDLAVTFLGTSSFLIRSAQSQVMVDGYLSRKWHYFVRSIAPDFQEVRDQMKRHNIRCSVVTCAIPGRPIDLILPLHGHYDHAMDSSLIAGWTGATRLSNRSLDLLHEATTKWAAEHGIPFEANGPTRNISNLRQAEVQGMQFGDMSFQLIGTPHNDNIVSRNIAQQTVEGFEFPASIFDMGEGQSLSVLVTHKGKHALIVGSSGHVGNRFAGIKASAIFLSIGGLRPKDVRKYWCDTVATVGAQRVFLIHWDNHQKRLPKGDVLLQPTFYEPHGDVLDIFRTLAGDDVEVVIPSAHVPFDPFANQPNSINRAHMCCVGIRHEACDLRNG